MKYYTYFSISNNFPNWFEWSFQMIFNDKCFNSFGFGYWLRKNTFQPLLGIFSHCWAFERKINLLGDGCFRLAWWTWFYSFHHPFLLSLNCSLHLFLLFLCKQILSMFVTNWLLIWKFANRDPDLEPAGATDEEDKKSDKTKPTAPRRKFEWNKDIR